MENIIKIVVSDEKIKEFIKKSIIEMIKEKRTGFYQIVLEAIEEEGLAMAITEGRKNKFVSENKIRNVLES
jgi:hypothetical protein